MMADDLAKDIAHGEVNPTTLERFRSIGRTNEIKASPLVRKTVKRKKGGSGKEILKDKTNLVTNYFGDFFQMITF